MVWNQFWSGHSNSNVKTGNSIIMLIFRVNQLIQNFITLDCIIQTIEHFTANKKKFWIDYEFTNTTQFLSFVNRFMRSYLFLIELITCILYVLGKNLGPDLVRSGRTRPATLGVRSCPGWTLICPVRLSPTLISISLVTN